MSRPSQNYPPELRERAVRMVTEVRENHGRGVETRGAMLLTFALDNGERDARAQDLPQACVASADVATLYSYALPYAAAPTRRIGFRTRKSGAGAIIDREGQAPDPI
jgi:hypothetical protein